MRVLAEYRWPGNVREMAAVMDRAVLIGQGTSLNVAAAWGAGAGALPCRCASTCRRPPRIEPLDVVVKRHIEAALRETHGRVEGLHGAARMLRVNPHTLRARMRKLRIDWQSFRRRGDAG